MKKFMNDFVKKMTLRNCLIATGFFLFFFLLIEFSPIGISKLLQITDGVNILDFENRYDSSFAYTHLLKMGENGRIFNLTRIIPLDSLFSVSFMFFSLTWLSFLLRPITLENCIQAIFHLFHGCDFPYFNFLCYNQADNSCYN